MLSTAEEYTPATNAWAPQPPMTIARYGVGAATAPATGLVNAIGGAANGGGGGLVYYPYVEAYLRVHEFSAPAKAEMREHLGSLIAHLDEAGSTIGVKGMIVAAKSMAMTTVDLLTEPAHIQKAKAEFDQKRGPGFAYKTRLADRKPALDYRK